MLNYLLNSHNVCLLQKLESFINYAFKKNVVIVCIHGTDFFCKLVVPLHFYYFIFVFFLPSAICICLYCKIAACVYDLLVFILKVWRQFWWRLCNSHERTDKLYIAALFYWSIDVALTNQRYLNWGNICGSTRHTSRKQEIRSVLTYIIVLN